MPEYTDEEKMRFRQEVDAKRNAGRRIDPTMRCTACNYKCTEGFAQQMGFKACPNCGSTQVEISSLDYTPGIPSNPLPSVREAEQQSRSQRPWVR